MTRSPDPLVRLRAVNPIPDVAEFRSDDEVRIADTLRIIFTNAVERRSQNRLAWFVSRRGGQLFAALIAFLMVGTGVAYAIGLPRDVMAAFAGEGQPTGAPVPWGAHAVKLSATLPLGQGEVLQVWTAANDLNGSCEYNRVLSKANVARNLGGGCEGGYPSNTKAGDQPAASSSVTLLHQSMDVQNIFPNGTKTSGSARYYFGQIFEPGVSEVKLVVPGHRPIPFILAPGGSWGIVKVPASTDGDVYDSSGVKVVLFGKNGVVRSTIDMATYLAEPCISYRANGSAVKTGSCSFE